MSKLTKNVSRSFNSKAIVDKDNSNTIFDKHKYCDPEIYISISTALNKSPTEILIKFFQIWV